MYLAAQAGVASNDLYGLLARYGRDVAGAVVVSDDDPQRRTGGAIPYDDSGLAEEVAGLEERSLALYDDSELSLPGLQNKLLLIRTEHGWARPTGGRPSTHILKVEDRRYPGLVSMEHAAMTLARRLGLTTAQTEVVSFGGVDCIIVSRFDRVVDGGGIERIHQEDICQALDMNAEAHHGRAKYEQHGGPGFARIAMLLDRYSTQPQLELTRLVEVLVFNVLIGNADAHAKNISLLHDNPGVVSLAPLYDTVPTRLWPSLPDRAAMHVNGVSTLSRVTISDVVAEAQRWPFDSSAVRDTAEDLVATIKDEINLVPVALADAVSERADQFLRR